MSTPRLATLPFELTRDHQVIAAGTVTTTEERRHGVLRLEGELLHVQWRVERQVQQIGPEIRTDVQHDGLREVPVPVRLLGDARVRRRGRLWWKRTELVLTARDLVAFDGLAGPEGFDFTHPAELALPVRTNNLELAREFALEVELAIADLALRAAEAALALSHAAPRALADPESTP